MKDIQDEKRRMSGLRCPRVELLYEGKVVYLRTCAFLEKMGGVLFGLFSYIFFIAFWVSVFTLNLGAMVVTLFTFGFFVYLANNCFEEEEKNKYFIETYNRRKE